MSYITHNCSGYMESLDQLQHQLNYNKIEYLVNSDVLIIGLQEIVEMKSKNLKKIIKIENEDALNHWKRAHEQLFPEFKSIATVSLLGLYLSVFVRRDQLDSLDFVISKHELKKIGFMNMANKGSLFLNLKINYDSMGLMTCHLHSGNGVKEARSRQDELCQILKFLEEQKRCSISLIGGDFNFRTTKGEAFEKEMAELISRGKHFKDIRDFELIASNEEMSQHKRQQRELESLKEALISFLPTYKMDPDTGGYNQLKQIPSWTDRIFYLEQDFTNFALIEYNSDPLTNFSDHLPVYLHAKYNVREIDIYKFKHIFD